MAVLLDALSEVTGLLSAQADSADARTAAAEEIAAWRAEVQVVDGFARPDVDALRARLRERVSELTGGDR
ncbi:hypothetical protein GCM10017607_20030 [Microbacterium thalassium]|nr:hypothetical protein GCM10017607_20030 [Microbacterium thalassium]